ncbi:hypothetical protein Plhal304r1_c063g0150771 [Plasmopara halstedii]
MCKALLMNMLSRVKLTTLIFTPFTLRNDSKMSFPPNAAFRRRASFFKCRHGKRSIYDFVQKLCRLQASLADYPISKILVVILFMEGLEIGPTLA